MSQETERYLSKEGSIRPRIDQLESRQSQLYSLKRQVEAERDQKKEKMSEAEESRGLARLLGLSSTIDEEIGKLVSLYGKKPSGRYVPLGYSRSDLDNLRGRVDCSHVDKLIREFDELRARISGGQDPSKQREQEETLRRYEQELKEVNSNLDRERETLTRSESHFRDAKDANRRKNTILARHCVK